MDRSGSDTATIVAVSRSPAHELSKPTENHVELIAGIGVRGDVHAGVTVRHRHQVRTDPTRPNLRQVHLIHDELLDELRGRGFDVAPGRLGENVTTRGLDLLGLPRGTRLRLGNEAVVEVTGLRNPCHQLDDFQHGLMKAVLDRDERGRLVRKAGIMGVVVTGGTVRPGDRIRVEVPAEPHAVLERV